MGLSRRTFAKEFKLAAVQRLEQGASLGEVARVLSVRLRQCVGVGAIPVLLGKWPATSGSDSSPERECYPAPMPPRLVLVKEPLNQPYITG